MRVRGSEPGPTSVRGGSTSRSDGPARRSAAQRPRPQSLPEPQSATNSPIQLMSKGDFLENFRVGELKDRSSAKRVPGVTKKAVAMPEAPDVKKPGYVIAVAGGAGASTEGIGKKYYDEAWGDVDDKAVRMGVVIGINRFESIEADASEKVVADSVGKAVAPPVNFDAFGFTWKPTWYQQTEKDKWTPVTLEEVREEYEQLDDTDGVTSNLEAWSKVGKAENLPYGLFREMVTASTEIQAQVAKLSTYNNPVYIHSADPDAKSVKVGATTEGPGVLSKYDEILAGLTTAPTLVLGGYNFRDFESEDELTERLTKLSNELDLVIRNAISRAYSLMLYPTEPNMLILAKDTTKGESGEDLFASGIFEGTEGSRTLKDQGGLWGHAASEGVALRGKLLEAGYSTLKSEDFLQYHSEASLPTGTGGTGQRFIVTGTEKTLGRKTAWDSVRWQAQSYVRAERLKHQFVESLVGPPAGHLRNPANEEKKDANTLNKLVKAAFAPVESIIYDLIELDFSIDTEALVEKDKKRAATARSKLQPTTAAKLEAIVDEIESTVSAIDGDVPNLLWELIKATEEADARRAKD